MSSRVGIGDLIELAEIALAEGADIDELISHIEAYSAAFHPWYEEHKETFEQGTESSGPVVDRDDLERLLKLHTEVLGKAELLQQGTSNDLMALRGRRKGMMAYIDILPKRLSTRRTRKG